ncbi:Method: conceptual translation supplied by author [Tuber indicum]|nr:Method: conceptual translation supplied by author [Tuber indicum]
MPAPIPLIKKARPEVKIIYLSHIEVRKDLVEPVWQWIWGYVKEVDVFISHPVDEFVPYSIPFEISGLMPAYTDPLYLKFYLRNLQTLCNKDKANHRLYPAREYITQIARFDPNKGLPDLIESYHQLCDRMIQDAPEMLLPQLWIFLNTFVVSDYSCEHGAIDDPDTELAFAQTRQLPPNSRYAAIAKDVGFEFKVSEALNQGRPVVATRAGGIPLQIKHGKSGFLVDVGDTKSVANQLFDLYTNDDLYARVNTYEKASVSDEVGTVDNAACWSHLTSKLARGNGLDPGARWIMDMAMEEAGRK